MLKQILKYPNPILKKKSLAIGEINDEIKALAKEMAEIMAEKQGVGLAAPQLGILKRIIVVKGEKDAAAFINPKIIQKSKATDVAEEGCLCFPGIFLEIKRAKKVEMEAINLTGEKIQFQAEGMLARVFQHEIDHLDGILISDKVPFWQKLKIRQKFGGT